MALPLLVRPSGFGSGGGTDSLDMVFGIIEGDKGRYRWVSVIFLARPPRTFGLLYQGQRQKAGGGNARGKKTRLVLSIDPEIISAQSLESETLCQTDRGSCHPITVDHTDGGRVKGGRYKGPPKIDVLASRDESCTRTAYAARVQSWRHDSLFAGAVYNHGMWWWRL